MIDEGISAFNLSYTLQRLVYTTINPISVATSSTFHTAIAAATPGSQVQQGVQAGLRNLVNSSMAIANSKRGIQRGGVLW